MRTLRRYSFTISQRSHPRKHIIKDSTTMGPRNQSTHWNTTSSSIERKVSTAGKARNYHATKKKPVASSSRPPNTHTTQQPSRAAQNTSSQLPPPATTASTFSAVPGGTGATGTVSRPHITGAGRRASFVAWFCCMPIKNAEGYH